MGTAGVAERTNNLNLYSWEDGPDFYNHVQLNYNWVTIDSDLLKKSWGGTADDATKIQISGTAGTAGIVFSTKVSADTEPRVAFAGDGVINWGAGGSITVDTNLYRAGSASLKTDGNFTIGGGTVSFLNGTATLVASDNATNRLDTQALFGVTRNALGTALSVNRTGDSVPTFIVTAEGLMGWGNGTSSADARIFRSGPGTLTLDADVYVNGKLTLGSAGVGGWNISNVTTTRTYNADQVTINELAETVGTLVNDLKTIGILGA